MRKLSGLIVDPVARVFRQHEVSEWVDSGENQQPHTVVDHNLGETVFPARAYMRSPL